MNENKYLMRICLRNKRITLNRAMIEALGSPSHLNFLYDEDAEHLYFVPAEKDELDSFEIPHGFWVRPRSACVISRIAFLQMLVLKINIEADSKYLYHGAYRKTDDFSAIVFNMMDGKRVR